MVNPAFPPNQMVGVFNLELARLYSYLYQKTDKNFSIVHALDGYDEISLTGDAKIISRTDEKIISPADYGLNQLQMSEISGGNTIENAAKIFMSVLENKSTDAQKQVVCANAALAIKTVKEIDLKEAYQEAVESIESGNALSVFKKLQELN
jgi:anthranilate phosphoribosyltransferase